MRDFLKDWLRDWKRWSPAERVAALALVGIALVQIPLIL